ncbi:MAG: TonB-dependent receptor [Steroidobacteraceae bacterium]|nr:TonB-dependent receptor [Nevskiaceae bacterium]
MTTRNALILLSISLLASSGAIAQQQSTRQPSDSAIEEVVVTAQRRAEKLREVPIAVSAMAGSTTPLVNDGEHVQFTQEIKLTGNTASGRMKYVTGPFGFYDDNDTSFANSSLPLSGPPTVTQDRTMMNKTQSAAVYFQADYSLTDRLTATADIRYTDDVMLFASATRGFKSGGWNARANFGRLALDFAAEKVWSYEAGARTEWFDGRWSLTAGCTNCSSESYVVSYLVYPYLPEPRRWSVRLRYDF